MSRSRLTVLLSLLTMMVALCAWAEFPVPETPFEVRRASVIQTRANIVIDGKGDDVAWQEAEWSPPFVDIRGYDYQPAPWYETRIKMLWGQDYFYILVWLEEPHLWATYDQHDMVIFHENDFEVFIDPDGDNHNYLELEINALGTTWDLLLTKPYRDDGKAIDSWEIPGLKSAVHLEGTLNDPSDVDEGWYVELAIPWEVINEVDEREQRLGQTSPNGMYLNFSRVEWNLDIDMQSGTYLKQTDGVSEEVLPEENWVWSPQGLIAMHYPERWGHVSPRMHGGQAAWSTGGYELKECAMLCYYAQKKYYDERNVYASKMKSLDLPKKSPYPDIEWPPDIVWMRGGYQMIVYSEHEKSGMRVREDGQLKKMPYHETWYLKYVQGVRRRPAEDRNGTNDE